MDLDGDENRATDSLLLSYGNNRQREDWTTLNFLQHTNIVLTAAPLILKSLLNIYQAILLFIRG